MGVSGVDILDTATGGGLIKRAFEQPKGSKGLNIWEQLGTAPRVEGTAGAGPSDGKTISQSEKWAGGPCGWRTVRGGW